MSKPGNWTPGPWLRHGTTIYALNEARTQNRFSASVQSVGRIREGEASLEECEANAQLITVAPELVEALEGLLSMVEHVLTDSQLDHEICGATIRRALKPAMAVLAKARGEERS